VGALGARLALVGRRLTQRPSAALRGLGLWWTFAAALVVAGAIIVAIAQNGRQVRVHYFVWQADVSLIVIILTTALVALVLDEAGGLIWRRRRRAKLGRRSELEQLRTAVNGPEMPQPRIEPSPQAVVQAGL